MVRGSAPGYSRQRRTGGLEDDPHAMRSSRRGRMPVSHTWIRWCLVAAAARAARGVCADRAAAGWADAGNHRRSCPRVVAHGEQLCSSKAALPLLAMAVAVAVAVTVRPSEAAEAMAEVAEGAG